MQPTHTKKVCHYNFLFTLCLEFSMLVMCDHCFELVEWVSGGMGEWRNGCVEEWGCGGMGELWNG